MLRKSQIRLCNATKTIDYYFNYIIQYMYNTITRYYPKKVNLYAPLVSLSFKVCYCFSNTMAFTKSVALLTHIINLHHKAGMSEQHCYQLRRSGKVKNRPDRLTFYSTTPIGTIIYYWSTLVSNSHEKATQEHKGYRQCVSVKAI